MMKSFYARLYPKYKLCKTTKEFLKHATCNMQHATPTKGKPNDNTETFIIGSKPDIISPRNFVSLDTRSREIRNKIQDIRHKTKNVANLIIRKYASSVGQEYFISFEDELGYLYGFTRLLLPRPEETVQVK